MATKSRSRAAPVRFRVGRQRIDKFVDPVEASYTQAIRSQMEAIEKTYIQFTKHIDDQTIQVLYNALEPTFEKSQDYCPMDTGALRESGYISEERVRGVNKIEIGYGAGGDPDYAAFVHEITEYAHKAPTRSKFLQAALVEDEKLIQERIIKGLQEAAGIDD